MINMDDLMTSGARPSGFEGERAVILPATVASMAARHPLLSGLRVTDAGYYPRARRHGIQRRNGAAGAVLILCREGGGWVRFSSGLQREVGPGDALLLSPHVFHAYGANAGDPWTIQWSHFEGTEIPDWWRFLKLPEGGGILRLCAGIPEQLDLGRVHEQLSYDLPSLLAAAAALRWALTNLRPTFTQADGADSSLTTVEGIETWMREHVGAHTRLDQLARRAALSPSHFAALFRKRFGFAPIDYFLRLKVQRACRLLDRTSRPISWIAEETGFSDPLYFSRRFRAVMGISPREFRTRLRD